MQHSRGEFKLDKSNSNIYCGSFTDNDSGIGLDYDYSSSSDLHSSTELTPRIRSKMISIPIQEVTRRKRYEIKPLIKFPSDGIVERIRPTTMKNSQNSDYIICQTNRGTYIAHRTPIVPMWVTQLVHEIELQQK